MKITEDRQDVLVGGAESVDAFTIKASAKAFQILSSNLYSNPLGSMIRELSTNAYDAHIDAGKREEPFIMTLPNSLEPTFKLRDFGPGLSHAQIMSVYTTFFESTKTESNDVVGCLGLGSKSPFGVADSFTVTSFYNGKRTVYSAFLNDARIPSIAKFAEFDTDEENGIELEVAIKEEDFYTFNREVNHQLKYFKTKPIIQGNSDFKWNTDEEYVYEGTNWKMSNGGGSARVIQGQIQYPISVNDMGKAYNNADDAIKAILGSSILFEVPIGDVNIAPSREALSYDDRTSENIIEAATTILKELPSMINKAIDDCETAYAARLKYKEIVSSLNMSYYHKDALIKRIGTDGTVMWKNVTVGSSLIEVPEKDINAARLFTKSYSGRYQKTNYGQHRHYGRNKIGEANWEFEATELKRTLWVYATPDDKAIDARSKQYANDKYGNSVRLNIIITDLTAQKLANRLGLKKSQLIIAKDLDKVRRKTYTTNGKNGGVKYNVVHFRYEQNYNKTDAWLGSTCNDLTDLEGYFVDLERYDVLDEDGNLFDDFRTMVKGAIELKIVDKDIKVYGLRKLNRKKDHNLVNFFQYVRENADKVDLKPKYDLGESEVVAKLGNHMTQLKEYIKDKPVDHPLRIVIEALVSKDNSTISYVAQQMVDKLNLHPKVINLRPQAKQLDTMYPMVPKTGYYSDSKDIMQYITHMDRLWAYEDKELAEMIAAEESER